MHENKTRAICGKAMTSTKRLASTITFCTLFLFVLILLLLVKHLFIYFVYLIFLNAPQSKGSGPKINVMRFKIIKRILGGQCGSQPKSKSPLKIAFFGRNSETVHRKNIPSTRILFPNNCIPDRAKFFF